MAKTKAEKITSIEEEIRQLENRRRQLVQEQKAQERKDRTKRLCRRMGLFESLVPDTIPLTEEQFKTFLEKTVMTDHARRILDGLTAQNGGSYPQKGVRRVAIYHCSIKVISRGKGKSAVAAAAYRAGD